MNDEKNDLLKEIKELQEQLTHSIENENNKKLLVKDLEIKNSELEKKTTEYQSRLQELIINQNLILQEDSNLKLEIKKLQLSVNSPGKVLASLGNIISKNENQSNDQKRESLIKEKVEMKEINEKLVLVLSEREAEILKIKSEHEKEILEMQKTITNLNAKINDLNNDLKDIQEQLNSRSKELQKIEENKNILAKYNLLSLEYDQYKAKTEKNKDAFTVDKEKMSLLTNTNKELNQRISKIEQDFNDLLKRGVVKVKDMNDLSVYSEISENLRQQIMEMEDNSGKMEKKYLELIKKNKDDYKKLEDKYMETNHQNAELQSNMDLIQENYVQGTVKLNNEMSTLKSKSLEAENRKKETETRIDNLLKDYEKLENNFKGLQKTMTMLREKDDIDITLIEERYIVLENMVDLEKNDLINQNKELLNKIKLLTSGGNLDYLLTDENKYNDLKLEIKNIQNDNDLLQKKLKDQERTIFQLQKKLETFDILKQENQQLKANLKENTSNFKALIKELTDKTNQLNDELLESRKRTSILRSLPNFNKEDVKVKVDNTMLNKDLEKYKKEVEELNEEIKKLKEENQDALGQVSSLKAKYANDIYTKDNEISKLKNLARKYKTMLEEKGLLKKK